MIDLRGRNLLIASDHAGFALKQALGAALTEWGVTVEDLGPFDTASVDYPEYAHVLATRIVHQPAALGVLVCGTGIGMSMAANRHVGIRAAVCTDPYQARMTRLHNDANVLCLGERVIGAGMAEDTLRVFLETEFEGGRHQRRVSKIDTLG